MINLVQKRRYFYGFSIALSLIFILAGVAWGFKFGIDFTGGSLTELSFEKERPPAGELSAAVSKLNFGESVVQPIGDKNSTIRMRELSEDEHRALSETIIAAYGQDQLISEERFESIGPIIGSELKRNSVYAILATILAITLFVAYAFRKVSKPVSSWKYGLVTLVALFHDVIIMTGVFIFLGRFIGVEIGTTFIVAILTVLGYSVNDTIVVFDRVRENLPRSEDNFEKTVNKSINETLSRSVNTALTTLFVLISMFFFGGETIKYFVLALSVGVVTGTYSSIFIASPLLVTWNKYTSSKKSE